MALHLSEDASQRSLEFGAAGKVSVVSSRPPRVLPQPFGGIELWRGGGLFAPVLGGHFDRFFHPKGILLKIFRNTIITRFNNKSLFPEHEQKFIQDLYIFLNDNEASKKI